MLDAAYINAVLSLAKACDLFTSWVGPAQCLLHFLFNSRWCVWTVRKRKKSPYEPGHVHGVNSKSTKGNFVIPWYTKKLRPPMGQLWKGWVPSREALGAVFSSLLLRVPFCLHHMQSAGSEEKLLNRCGIDISLSCLCSVLEFLNFCKLLSSHRFFTPFFPRCLCSNNMNQMEVIFLQVLGTVLSFLLHFLK